MASLKRKLRAFKTIGGRPNRSVEWTSPGFRRLIPKERHKPKRGHQSFSEWAKITLGPKGSKDDSLDSLLVCVCVCVCVHSHPCAGAQVFEVTPKCVYVNKQHHLLHFQTTLSGEMTRERPLPITPTCPTHTFLTPQAPPSPRLQKTDLASCEIFHFLSGSGSVQHQLQDC